MVTRDRLAHLVKDDETAASRVGFRQKRLLFSNARYRLTFPAALFTADVRR